MDIIQHDDRLTLQLHDYFSLRKESYVVILYLCIALHVFTTLASAVFVGYLYSIQLSIKNLEDILKESNI